MKTLLISICLLPLAFVHAGAQVDSLILPEPRTLDLPSLISEALELNPAIIAAAEEMNAMDARAKGAGSLDAPELLYMREEMPQFRFSEARASKWELMQMIMLPNKLSTMKEMALLEAEHAYHDHLEVINSVVADVTNAYMELWFVQQRQVLDLENARLLRQVAAAAGERYAAGLAPQHDVLKTQMELAMLGNALTDLRQMELTAKEMLRALIGRPATDTLGYAIISEAIPVLLPLDSLERTAMRQRPMVTHDSMMIDEARLAQVQAGQSYLPDLRLGVEYMSAPMDHMNAWSVTVGVSLPFAPWAIGRQSARSEEADARLRKAQAGYESTRSMVLADLRRRYYEAASQYRQLSSFRDLLLPQADQMLSSVMTSYQNGRAEFMMLLESYRTVTNVTTEYFMTRMKYEQSLAALQRAVGVRTVADTIDEEVQP